MRKLLFKGPVTTASGYGVHARQILKALISSEEFDISVRCLNWGNTSILHDDSVFFEKIQELAKKFEIERQNGTQYDVSVQVTIPNEFENLARTNVGVTAGIEVDLCSPVWILKSNDVVDALIVPSQHSKSVMENTSFRDQNDNVLSLNKPALLAHEGFDPKFYNTEPSTGPFLELEPEFNFLFVGLGLKGQDGSERKDITNLIKLFCDAFRDRKDVGLVLKTAIVNNSLLDFENTRQLIENIKKSTGCSKFPMIKLVHGHLSDEEMSLLYKNPKIKAFVSLTHGEGFGLPLLEAAACGLPVVATNWSGHLDFLSIPGVKNSFVPLDFDLVDVPDSAVWKGVIEKGSKWAQTKNDDVKLKLRKVQASYDKPKEWATKLSKHVYENFTESLTMSRLVDMIIEICARHETNEPVSVDGLVSSIRSTFSDDDEGPKLLYTMPMSAGDVFISTAVVDSLKKKFPEHKIFFATKDEYASILDGNPNVHKVVAWGDWMMNVSTCEQIFDEVFTPNVGVQMTFSNWVHGGKGRLLGDELAVQCCVEFGDYFIKTKKPQAELPKNYIVINPGSGKGQWAARSYRHWQEVLNNLIRETKNIDDFGIVQVGMNDDPSYEGCIDFRGKTKDFNELAYVVENSKLVLGIDSVTMHLAAGLGVDHVALFGSSYPTSTGPVVPMKTVEKYFVGIPDTTATKLPCLEPVCSSILLETNDRYTCDKACYKYDCRVDAEHPCINEIDPKDVFFQTMNVLWRHFKDKKSIEDDKDMLDRYQELRPKISGYTHVFNAESGGYPYVESISSMLGFCDEVIVVDGGSTDGTVEKIEALNDERINVIEHEWDWDEPGVDGMQKAYARAMCTGDFLWQQDVDEIVHEDDFDKIKALVKRFPTTCDLLHLPIIELWGDDHTVRTDRHAWKWRLSRNSFKITHGIVKHARMLDKKTGKVYAKRGASDGCEYIDIMTNDYVPHQGFYSQQLEQIRQTDPTRWGEVMNDAFEQLPSVFHYSWADIPRKIKNFKQTWDSMWTNLYRDQEPEDRFPNVVDENDVDNIMIAAKLLVEQGGEHVKSKTFELRRSRPSSMTQWSAKEEI